MKSRLLPLALVASLAPAACTASSAGPQPVEAACTLDVQVDRFKELVIVDDAVMGDARARNATNGAWSFRHAIESMTPVSATASDFVLGWLKDWEQRKSFNGAPLDREPRDYGLRATLLCPWLRSTPENGCNADCSTCTTTKLDLALAPLRLIAISNRMDLADKADAAGPNGEGRLLFALTSGPADDPQSRPLPMTLIMEYRLPTDLSRVEWANQWHTLSAFKEFDEPYRVALQQTTDRFTARGVRADATNGSAIAQIRTNESAFNWIWQQREFTLDPAGQLRGTSTKDTPAESFNNTAALATFITSNRDKINEGSLVVPAGMLGGSSNALLYQWNAPGVDAPTMRAFARQTCNGCHTDNPNVDSVFHISPFRSGVEKVSRFLNDPSNRSGDELTKRAELSQKILCLH